MRHADASNPKTYVKRHGESLQALKYDLSRLMKSMPRDTAALQLRNTRLVFNVRFFSQLAVLVAFGCLAAAFALRMG